MRVRIPDWGKGMNLAAQSFPPPVMPSELDLGMCSGASNVRFRSGFAERIGGCSSFITTSVLPYWVGLYPSTSEASYGCYPIYAGLQKVMAANFGGIESEITRYTEGVAISSITNSTTTATVTTASAHGRTTGDSISVWGCLSTQYNGTFTITVTSTTAFTYTMASDPGGSASTVGLYSYNGSTQNFTTTFTANHPQQYSGGVFNGIFILNAQNDGLYYWNGSTSTRLRMIPGSYKSRASRPFKNYIFQLSPTVSGTEFPYRVLWSAAADPGSIPTSFAASQTNDAGFVELATAGDLLVDALPLGDSLVIYKEYSRYSAQYVGGSDVFSFTRLPGVDGLFSTGCVVDTPVGHIYMNRNLDVLVHSGGQSTNLSSGRVRFTTWRTAFRQTFLVADYDRSEVWVVFCDGSSAVPNRAFIYSWLNDTWGVKDIPSGGYSYGAFGSFGTYSAPGVSAVGKGLVFAWTGNALGVSDTDYRDFNNAYSSYIERQGMDLGSPDDVKTLHRSRWNFDGVVGATYQVEHGSAMTADAAPTYSSAVTYTLGTTDYCNARATGGKYLATRVTWTPTSSLQPGRVRSCDLDVTMQGKR